MKGLFGATVLWKNAIVASMQPTWIHRMSVVLIRERENWRILLIHVTAIQPPYVDASDEVARAYYVRMSCQYSDGRQPVNHVP